MNILFLCNKNPYPERDGGCAGINCMIKQAVNDGHYVKVLAVNSYKNFIKCDELPRDYRESTHYENIFLDMKVRPLMFLSTFFTKKSPHVVRFYSKEFDDRLKAILFETDFQVVRLESVFMAPYINTIRKFSSALIDMRAHNIEHLIWYRISKSANLVKKLLMRHVASTLEKYELEVIKRVDVISAISEVEAQWFRSHTNIQVLNVPFGVDLQKVKFDASAEVVKNSVFYIGAMDWQPNEEGVDWFLSKVWHTVHAEMPELKFYLAGRNMPEKYYHDTPENVVVVGEVPDAYEYMYTHELMVVPLLSGGGVRVKIFEGMTMSKAVVTTTIGAEGIELTNGKDVFISDDADAFAANIIMLAKNKQMMAQIGASAHDAAQKYDAKVVFKKWLEEISDIIKKEEVTAS